MRKLVCLSLACLILVLAGCETKKEEPAVVEQPTASNVEILFPRTEPAPPEVPDASGVESAKPGIGHGGLSPVPRNDAAVPPPGTRRLFQEPVEPQLYELPSEALITWREFRSSKPVLVIMADQPCLWAPPAPMQEEARRLILEGSEEELRRRADYNHPDPVVLGPQAVRAALSAGLFSGVIWILPTDQTVEEFRASDLTKKLLDSKILSAEDARNVSWENGVAALTMEGVPVRITHPAIFSEYRVSGPVVFHLDLSYLKSIYRNEIHKSIYTILYNTAKLLRTSDLDVLAVTLSYSNSDNYVGLPGRFALPTLAQLLRTPQLLDEEMPSGWKVRAEALYMQNMFMESRVTELYQKALDEAPQDPAALYDLAQRRFFKGGFAEGLKLLDKAVTIDPGYCGAYAELAQKAKESGASRDALMLIEKAHACDPANPFLDIQRAGMLQQAGKKAEALDLLQTLEKLPWSKVYHGQVPALLEGMKENPEPASYGGHPGAG